MGSWGDLVSRCKDQSNASTESSAIGAIFGPVGLTFYVSGDKPGLWTTQRETPHFVGAVIIFGAIANKNTVRCPCQVVSSALSSM